MGLFSCFCGNPGPTREFAASKEAPAVPEHTTDSAPHVPTKQPASNPALVVFASTSSLAMDTPDVTSLPSTGSPPESHPSPFEPSTLEAGSSSAVLAAIPSDISQPESGSKASSGPLPHIPANSNPSVNPASVKSVATPSEPEPEHPAVVAWRHGLLGFSFSGGGFLLPYHLGVLDGLSSLGIITPGLTPLAGASAGSLAVTSFHIGWHPIHDTLKNVMELAETCRAEGTKKNLDRLLRAHLLRWLAPTPDAHQRVSGCTAIAVTKMLPVARAVQLTQFFDVEDLVDALAASCFLPRYSGSITTRLRGGVVADGSLVEFIPRIPKHMWETAATLKKRLDAETSPEQQRTTSHALEQHSSKGIRRSSLLARHATAQLLLETTSTAPNTTAPSTSVSVSPFLAEAQSEPVSRTSRSSSIIKRKEAAHRTVSVPAAAAAGGTGRARRLSSAFVSGFKKSMTTISETKPPKIKKYRAQVSCFPQRHLEALPVLSRAPIKKGLDICPAEESWPYSIRQTFLLSVHPAGDTFLKGLANRGRADAIAWAHRIGLAQAVAAAPRPPSLPGSFTTLGNTAAPQDPAAAQLTNALDLAAASSAGSTIQDEQVISGCGVKESARVRALKQGRRKSADPQVLQDMQTLAALDRMGSTLQRMQTLDRLNNTLDQLGSHAGALPDRSNASGTVPQTLTSAGAALTAEELDIERKKSIVREQARAVAARKLKKLRSVSRSIKRQDSSPDLLADVSIGKDMADDGSKHVISTLTSNQNIWRARRFSALVLAPAPEENDGDRDFDLVSPEEAGWDAIQWAKGPEHTVVPQQMMVEGCHGEDDPHEAFRLHHDPRQPHKGYSALAVLSRLLL